MMNSNHICSLTAKKYHCWLAALFAQPATSTPTRRTTTTTSTSTSPAASSSPNNSNRPLAGPVQVHLLIAMLPLLPLPCISGFFASRQHHLLTFANASTSVHSPEVTGGGHRLTKLPTQLPYATKGKNGPFWFAQPTIGCQSWPIVCFVNQFASPLWSSISRVA